MRHSEVVSELTMMSLPIPPSVRREVKGLSELLLLCFLLLLLLHFSDILIFSKIFKANNNAQMTNSIAKPFFVNPFCQ